MTLADWLICALVLVNVVTAAMQGFFSEALTMAGLVVGYIVAAWKYRAVAEWLEQRSDLLDPGADPDIIGGDHYSTIPFHGGNQLFVRSWVIRVAEHDIQDHGSRAGCGQSIDELGV